MEIYNKKIARFRAPKRSQAFEGVALAVTSLLFRLDLLDKWQLPRPSGL